jgi:hypothetical protein
MVLSPAIRMIVKGSAPDLTEPINQIDARRAISTGQPDVGTGLVAAHAWRNHSPCYPLSV